MTLPNATLQRPGLNARSQAGVEDVDANTVYRRKIITFVRTIRV